MLRYGRFQLERHVQPPQYSVEIVRSRITQFEWTSRHSEPI
jgi:hypothetical protein